MSYYTENGDRPDLASLEVNPPEGYIGSKLLPTMNVVDKSGTVYYATVTADAAAQTGRVAGAAPDGTQISDSSTSYTCAEAIKRGSVTPDEAKQMGGIANADRVGASWAKRQTMNAIETAIKADTLDKAASVVFDAASFFEQSQTALDTIRRYEGKTVLYGATITLKKTVQQVLADATYGSMVSRAISGSSPEVAVQGMSFDAWMRALALLTGVDEVLAGDSAIWNAGDSEDKIGFAKIDDGMDQLSHKWKPVLGKVFQFLPDGNQPWSITSVADLVNINNHYDAQIWYESVLLNTAANYTISGVSG